MKTYLHIAVFLLLMVVGCARIVDDRVEEKATPSLLELSTIDSLMWQRADSALAVMMEFATSLKADSLDVFNEHYCQLLISELLFKNDYEQSNRKELLQAVAYFDSITQVPEPAVAEHGRSVEGPSNKRNAFLSARAHYMNGVGYYEHASLVAACDEYLKALEIMETHFQNLETQDVTALQIDHLPRFMALTYGRLGDLFSELFMTEPAIACYKKSLVFTRIEPTSDTGIARVLISLGQQYDILRQTDSAEYYYNEAFNYLPDTNNLVYRDLISGLAVYHYYSGKGVEPTVSDLKRMATQTADEDEQLTRYFGIGSIYYETSQFDSAMVYLTRVFENKDNVVLKRDVARCLRDIFQIIGDSLRAAQYARYQVENPVFEEESNRRVSQLNELFQQHLQREEERNIAIEKQLERQRMVRGLVTAAIIVLVLCLVLWWWMAKRRKEHEAETQTLNEEKQQLQTQVDEALQQLQTQADDALQQARAMLPQRAKDLLQSKVPNRLERIMAEFEAAYPKVLERLTVSCSELSEAERQIAVLNFLHFRAKEEAELTGFAENTILKYRSNLHKKAGSDPISVLIAEERI